jgi:hypothetical protein
MSAKRTHPPRQRSRRRSVRQPCPRRITAGEALAGRHWIPRRPVSSCVLVERIRGGGRKDSRRPAQTRNLVRASTVRRVLRRASPGPAPRRTGPTWAESWEPRGGECWPATSSRSTRASRSRAVSHVLVTRTRHLRNLSGASHQPARRSRPRLAALRRTIRSPVCPKGFHPSRRGCSRLRGCFEERRATDIVAWR